MRIDGRHYESIWIKENDPTVVQIIDQRFLPFQLVIEDLKTPEAVVKAIKEMHLRGAPLIGAAAGLAIYLALVNYREEGNPDTYLLKVAEKLIATRPTAINLKNAVDRQMEALIHNGSLKEKIKRSFEVAQEIISNERENCRKIGEYGLDLIKRASKKKNGKTVNILTHCNAGWLACIDYGTATAPVYMAHDKGIDVHVWVDETRPRNQGARLTVWELMQHGVPCTLITDNTGGHLMQHDLVDMVIVGSDRTTLNGDVANKIGTYLKALAANDNNIPFYVALPSSTIDWKAEDGLNDIPIEMRDEEEIKYLEGEINGRIGRILLTVKDVPAANYAFDVTPARLVTALITEKGICQPNKENISNLFPDKLKLTIL